MKFNFEKPETKPKQETETEKVIPSSEDTTRANGTYADVEDFSKTSRGRKTLDNVYHKSGSKEEAIYEQNSEKFTAEMAERLNAKHEKMKGVLDRFKILSEKKKNLFRKKAGRVMTKLGGLITTVGAVGGIGSFVAANFAQGQSVEVLGGAAVIGATSALVAGFITAMKGVSQKDIEQAHAEKHAAGHEVYEKIYDAMDSKGKDQGKLEQIESEENPNETFDESL